MSLFVFSESEASRSTCTSSFRRRSRSSFSSSDADMLVSLPSSASGSWSPQPNSFCFFLRSMILLYSAHTSESTYSRAFCSTNQASLAVKSMFCALAAVVVVDSSLLSRRLFFFAAVGVVDGVVASTSSPSASSLSHCVVPWLRSCFDSIFEVRPSNFIHSQCAAICTLCAWCLCVFSFSSASRF